MKGAQPTKIAIRGERHFGPLSISPDGVRLDLPRGGNLTYTRRNVRERSQSAEVINPPGVIFVSDFGRDHARLECQLIADAIFTDRGVVTPTFYSDPYANPFDIDHGSRIIAQMARGARKGTLILGVVDPGVGSTGDKQRRRIIIKTNKDHIAVGPDNGLFSELIAEEGVAQAWEINAGEVDRRRAEVVERQGLHFNRSTTFDGRDYFAPVVAFIATGDTIDSLATPIDVSTLVRREIPLGSVVDVDPYGDVKVREQIPDDVAGLYLQRSNEEGAIIEEYFPLKSTYADVGEGENVALRSSNEYLELAVREGSAAEIHKIHRGDMLKIRWATLADLEAELFALQGQFHPN